MKNRLILISLITLTIVFTWISISFYEFQTNSWAMGADNSEYWELSDNIIYHQRLATQPEWNIVSYLDEVGESQWQRSLLENNTVYSLKRIPGYILLLSALRLLWDNHLVAFFLNIVAYFGILLFSWRIGKYFFKNEIWRSVYFFSVALSPIYFAWTGIQSDTVTSAFVAGFIFYLLNIFFEENRNRSKYSAFMLCLFSLLSIVLRPNLLIVVFGMLVLIIGISWLKKRKQEWTLFLALLICSVFILAWSYRNYKLSDVFSPTVFIGYNMWGSYFSAELSPNPIMNKFFDHITPDNEKYYKWIFQKQVQKYIASRMNNGRSYYQAVGDMDHKTKDLTLEYFASYPFIAMKKIAVGYVFYHSWTCFDIPYILLTLDSSAQRKVYINGGKNNVIPALDDGKKSLHKVLLLFSYCYKRFVLLVATLFWIAFFRSLVTQKQTSRHGVVSFVGFVY